MENNMENVATKQISEESLVEKVVTLTCMKRMDTREVTAVFDPSVRLTKVENLFEVENVKSMEDYAKDILHSFLTYMGRVVYPRLVCDLPEEGVLLIPGKLRIEYDDHVWPVYKASFDKTLIKPISGPIAYATLLDEEDFVIAKSKGLFLGAYGDTIDVTFTI